MKKRGNIIIVLTVCFSIIGFAGTDNLPTQQHAIKLMAAACKEPIQSIDVTFYETIKEVDKSESEIRKNIEKSFEIVYGPKHKLSTVTLERLKRDIEVNVAMRIKEQQIGRNMKVRIQFDDNRQRMDMVFGKPEVIIFPGTIHEERITKKQLDANTPFEMTDVDVIDREGVYTHFEYLHETKFATIRTESGKKFERSNIPDFKGFPDDVCMIIQGLLGKKETTYSGEVYLPDETKIDRLCSGKLNNADIRIYSDKEQPKLMDMIEVVLNKDGSKFIEINMVCDKENYSKVYYYETLNPITSLPILKRTCNKFDSNAFPYILTETEYDDKGNIKREKTHRIENIQVNMPIPNDVFEFNPPKDYTIDDMRLTSDERKKQEIERMKEWLGHNVWTDRLRALVTLEQYLKDNPEELRNIAISMKDDERLEIRTKAAMILQGN